MFYLGTKNEPAWFEVFFLIFNSNYETKETNQDGNTIFFDRLNISNFAPFHLTKETFLFQDGIDSCHSDGESRI